MHLHETSCLDVHEGQNPLVNPNQKTLKNSELDTYLINTSCLDAKSILQNSAGNLGEVHHRSRQLQQVNPSFSCDLHPVMIAALLGNLFIFPPLSEGFCRSLKLAINF